MFYCLLGFKKYQWKSTNQSIYYYIVCTLHLAFTFNGKAWKFFFEKLIFYFSSVPVGNKENNIPSVSNLIEGKQIMNNQKHTYKSKIKGLAWLREKNKLLQNQY